MLAYYGLPPRIEWLFLPVVLAGLIVLAMAIGTLLAALTVEYRDFRHLVPFMMQLWMFMTPAIYLQTGLTAGSRTETLAMLNPMTGLVANFRTALVGGSFDFTSLGFSFLVGIVVLVGASLHFRRVERRFADII
jgi:lipopolysaccharide transport system permease protein